MSGEFPLHIIQIAAPLGLLAPRQYPLLEWFHEPSLVPQDQHLLFVQLQGHLKPCAARLSGRPLVLFVYVIHMYDVRKQCRSHSLVLHHVLQLLLNSGQDECYCGAADHIQC